MDTLRRRTFLGALGGALLGARVLDPRRASAQTRTARRFVVFYSSDGTQLNRWRPDDSNGGLRFPAGSILEPLEPVKQHLTVLDGLEYANGREHFRGMALMLTNSDEIPPAVSMTDGASIDQYIAANLGAPTRFRSLELGVQSSIWGAIPESRMCFRRTREPIPPNEDPFDVYRRLFGEASDDAAQTLADRRSVLDLVRAELGDMSAQLGAEEKRKLDVHLDALRDVERGLEGLGARCEAAPIVAPSAHLDNDAFPAVGRAQMDLLVAALACDLTRVASIQWSMAASPTVFSWLGHSESHHSLSHVEDPQSAGVAQFIAGERWYSEQFRYLVERLASLPEPGGQGSLLDNTIVLWVTEVGNRLTHVCDDMPVVLAGGGSGVLRPGRMLRYPGQSHGKLLTSLCRAFGLENPSFGDEAPGVGVLDGLLT